MAFRRGPFTFRWAGNEFTDVEEVDTNVEQDTDERTTVTGTTFEFDGAIKASATIKLLRSDVPTLAALLPQYFVPNGQEMSTGETVNQANGAIDVKAASCDTSSIYGDLDIITCGSPQQVFRLVNARTKIEDVETDAFLQTVTVRFIGEPAAGEGNIQFFQEGSIAVVS